MYKDLLALFNELFSLCVNSKDYENDLESLLLGAIAHMKERERN